MPKLLQTIHELKAEHDAKQHLIAAAPALLAALIAFDNAFSHYCEGDPDSDEVSALYQAREAIAKATGKPRSPYCHPKGNRHAFI